MPRRSLRSERSNRGGSSVVTALDGSSVSTPAWVLSGATIDMDFANGRYFGDTLANLLTISRASNATDLLPSSASGYVYNTYGSNVLAISPTFGLLIFEARTNLLLNSTAPATQTTGSLGTGTYTLWVNGSGSALASGGTATITGAASATNGSPNTFTVTVAGTVTVTVTGSLNFFQLELGASGTSGIVTAGTTVARASDLITGSGALQTIYTGGTCSLVAATSGGSAITTETEIVGTQTTVIAMGVSSGLKAFTYNGGASLPTGNSTNLTGNNKIGVGLTQSSARSVVLNNGTVATDANNANIQGKTIYLGSTNTGSNFLNRALSRLTVFNSLLSNGTLQAFTV